MPDSISTDLHIGSMNAGMKDMLNVMSKFLALGLPPRRRRSALHLEPGARDQAGGARAPVGGRARRRRRAAPGERQLRLRGLVRRAPARRSRSSTCEMTLRDGKVVYDLNGLARPDWETLPKDYRSTGDPRWAGRQPREVMMAKSNRRSFLTKAPALAVAVGAAAAPARRRTSRGQGRRAPARTSRSRRSTGRTASGRRRRRSSAASSPTATCSSSPASAPTSRATSRRTPSTCWTRSRSSSRASAPRWRRSSR